MTTERWIRVAAGCLVLLSIYLAVSVNNKYWLILAGVVAINLIQSAITNWCLLEKVLKEFGIETCCEKKKEG